MAGLFDDLKQQAKPGGGLFGDLVPAATERQRLLSSVPMRVARGMKDPIDGGAQLLSRVPGAGAVNAAADAVGGFLNRQVFNRLGLPGDFAGEVLGIRGATPEQLDAEIKAADAEYESARRATAPITLATLVNGERDPGFDAARLVGNVVSPVNAALGRLLPAVGNTVKARAATGAIAGGAAGALQPVTNGGESFTTDKLGQVAIGSATGGALTPVVGAAGDRALQVVANRQAAQAAKFTPDPQAAEALAQRMASEVGQSWVDMAPAMRAQMTAQATEALKGAAGRKDPMTLARLSDFRQAGIEPTLGQITRDPRQFANEMNLRQVAGAGDPLLQRFQAQGAALQEKVGGFAKGAQDAYTAGNAMMAPLRAYDEKLSAGVRAAYRAARDSAGKDAELPLQGLAQDAAEVLDNFGDKVPSGVLNQLRKFGILPDQAGTPGPRKLFTVEEADKLLKVINASGSRTDDATNAALSQLRAAVKNAVTAEGADDVFAPARKLAAERFQLHDSVQALSDVARGRATPDAFVDRYIVGAGTDEAKRLADILRKESPEAFAQARAQLGAKLARAAFGENITGDKAFSAERYAQTLRQLGQARLSAFFSPSELAQLERLGRVGAYINQFPNRAPVQTSGNFGALMDIAARIPGMPAVVGMVRSAANSAQQSGQVNRALAANPAVQPAQVAPESVSRLSDLLVPVGVTSGALAVSGAQ